MKKLSFLVILLLYAGQMFALQQELNNFSQTLKILVQKLAPRKVTEPDEQFLLKFKTKPLTALSAAEIDKAVEALVSLEKSGVLPNLVIAEYRSMINEREKEYQADLENRPLPVPGGNGTAKTNGQIPLPPAPSTKSSVVPLPPVKPVAVPPSASTVPTLPTGSEPVPAVGPEFISGRYARINYAKKSDGTMAQYQLGLARDPDHNIENLVLYGPELSMDVTADNFVQNTKIAYPISKAKSVKYNLSGDVAFEGPKKAVVLVDGKKYRQEVAQAKSVEASIMPALEGFNATLDTLDNAARENLSLLKDGNETKNNEVKEKLATFINSLAANFDKIKPEASQHYLFVVSPIQKLFRSVIQKIESIINVADTDRIEKLKQITIGMPPKIKESITFKMKLLADYIAFLKDQLQRVKALQSTVAKTLEKSEAYSVSPLRQLYSGLLDKTMSAKDILQYVGPEVGSQDISDVVADEPDISPLEDELRDAYSDYREMSLEERKEYMLKDNSMMLKKLDDYIKDGNDLTLRRWQLNVRQGVYDYPPVK